MKKKYSTLLNFALATCVATTLVACSDGDYTGPILGRDSNPTVNIGGTVLDTNGNPLTGVTVSCEGVQQKTNSSGQYNILNVRAHNIIGGRTQSTNSYDEQEMAVSCVIEAPSGYLGARVYVWPEAQVINTLYDNTSEGNGQTNQPLLWIEGMYAEAMTAWLPKLDSEVCGVLRMCDTGEPVTDAQVKLDMWAVNNNYTVEQAPSSSSYPLSEVQYSTGEYMVQTDVDDATFCLSNVPNDSILRLHAPEYQDISVLGNDEAVVNTNYGTCSGTTPCTAEGEYITTVNEGLLTLGNVCVESISKGDSIRPCVASIEGWTARDGWETVFGHHSGSDQLRYAVLHDDLDGTQGIDIGFNESLTCDEIDENSVVIWDDDLGTSGDYITGFTTACSGSTLTVTTDEAIGEDHHILIYMLVDDFRDLAGNFLTAYDLPSDGACDNVYFAEEFVSGNGQWYVAVGIKMFSQDSTDAPAVTELQPVCKDEVGNGGFPALTGDYPQTFIDTYDDYGDYQNLSAMDTVHSDEWEDRMEGLADVQGFDSADVDNGWGHVKFFPPAEGYWAEHNFSCYDWWTDGAGMVHCVFSGAEVGDTVRINTLDDFFNVSDYAETTLVDCVAPTTIPQFGYNTCGYSFNDQDYADFAEAICLSTDTDTIPQYGDGAENTSEGVIGNLGIPTLNITCRLLKNAVDPADPPVAPFLSNPIDIYGLYDGDNGLAYPTLAPCGSACEYDAADQLYDSLEYAAFVPFQDTIGVAFTEDIDPVDGMNPTFTGTTMIDGWFVINDVTSTDDSGDQNPVDGGEGTSSDLAGVTFADVIALSIDDHGQTLGFDNAVTDSNGVAANNANVMINDLMPPMVTRAYWDGDLVIEFNEDINWTNINNGRCAIRAGGNTYFLDYASDDHVASGQSIVDNVLTITNPAGLDKADFNLGVWPEATYNDLIAAGTDLPHAELDTSCVPDTVNGTTWDMYDNTGGWDAMGSYRQYRTTENDALCNTPEFMMVDVIPPFAANISVLSGSFTDGSVDDLVIRIGWNLPLDICTTFSGTFPLVGGNCSLTGDPGTAADDNTYMNANWTYLGAPIAGIPSLQVTNTTFVNSTNGFVQFTLDNNGTFVYFAGDQQYFDGGVNVTYTYYTVSNGDEGWLLPTLQTQ